MSALSAPCRFWLTVIAMIAATAAAARLSSARRDAAAAAAAARPGWSYQDVLDRDRAMGLADAPGTVTAAGREDRPR